MRLTIKKAKLKKINASEDNFIGEIFYQGLHPDLVNYDIGFLWGESDGSLQIVLAASISVDKPNRIVSFTSEMGNLLRDDIFVKVYIQPKSEQSKYNMNENINVDEFYTDLTP